MARLAPHHYAELHEGSGISDEVIEARGAFSVTFPAELRDIGFPEWQARLAPGYVLPLHTPNGFPETYVFKPDTPRKEIKESGKVRLVKYEYPAGAQVRLDVPPCCRNLVLDPEIPLLFVEGWKKGDKGATEGLAVVVVGGVWNFLSGGIPLPDFRDIPLKGRKVAICFDSDVARNESVRMARERFAQVLADHGARVYFITLPDAADGSKQGLDDYLLHKPAWAVWALAEQATPAADGENSQIKAQLRELQARESAMARLAANKHTRKYFPVAIRAAAELDQVKAQESPTEQGDYRISQVRVRGVEYDEYGAPRPDVIPVCSEGTVSSHLEEIGKIVPEFQVDKRPGIVTLTRKDRNTGEKIKQEIPSTLTYVKWDGTSTDLLNALASYRTEAPERRGGKRCPDCGSQRIKPVKWACQDCGSTFSQPAEQVHTTEAPIEPDSTTTQAWDDLYRRTESRATNFAGRGDAPPSALSHGHIDEIFDPAESPAAKFVAGDTEGRGIESPLIPLATNFAAGSASVRCTFTPFGCECPHPDRCSERGRCSP